MKPVPGETNTGNNTVEFPVNFRSSVTVDAGVVAIVAAAVAVVGCSRAAWWLVGRTRARGSRCAAQQMLLGGGRRDLVEFAVSLQGRIDDLHRAVDEVAAGLSRVDRRVDGSVTNTSVVRYDAYEDAAATSRRSFALLDAARTGTVVTAIQGRDYARIYMKELDRGTRLDGALARGAGGGRARDGPLAARLI